MRGIAKLTSQRKLFSIEKSAKAMKPAVNFSDLLVSEQFVMIGGKDNIQGDNLVEYCI
jgi:hypothetical protein